MILDYPCAFRAVAELDPTLAVCVSHRGPASDLKAALESVAAQRGIRDRLAVIVGADMSPIELPASETPTIPGSLVRCSMHAGNASTARNDLIRLVRAAAPSCRAIVRLDSDDVLASPRVLLGVDRRVRSVMSSKRRVDALLFGNLQSREGRTLCRPNLPQSRLLTRPGLLDHLDGMTQADPRAELPSCNLVLLPGSRALYPMLPSAEDHALVARLLTRGRLALDDTLVQTIYRLGGSATKANQQAGKYRESRRRIMRQACAT